VSHIEYVNGSLSFPQQSKIGTVTVMLSFNVGPLLRDKETGPTYKETKDRHPDQPSMIGAETCGSPIIGLIQDTVHQSLSPDHGPGHERSSMAGPLVWVKTGISW